MIIEVNQTKANLVGRFEVYYNNVLKFYGAQSALTSMRANSLLGLDDGVVYKTRFTPVSFLRKVTGSIVFFIWVWSMLAMNAAITSLPVKVAAIGSVFFAYVLFDFRKRKIDVYKVLNSDGDETAEFCLYRGGFLNSYYLIDIDGKTLKVYSISKSSQQYIPIYMDDKQIGQINKLLHVVNNKDNYVLYLLDEHKQIAGLLSLFVIYFDSRVFGRRGEVSIGAQKTWEWTYSKSNSYYDQLWV